MSAGSEMLNYHNEHYIKLSRIKDAISRHTPKPAEPVEPLAVLADRKGLSVYWIKRTKTHWCIILCTENYRVYVKQGIDFSGATYDEAEQSARAYLSSLPDKMGGK
jgi:hypothetical protein